MFWGNYIISLQFPFDKSIRLFHVLIEPTALYNEENGINQTDKQLDKLKAGISFGYTDKSSLDSLHSHLWWYGWNANNY